MQVRAFWCGLSVVCDQQLAWHRPSCWNAFSDLVLREVIIVSSDVPEEEETELWSTQLVVQSSQSVLVVVASVH
jgi:transcription elongation factor Elf1